MSLFTGVILLGLLFDFVLHTLSDGLNLKALKEPPPESVASLYAEEGLSRSRAYVRAATVDVLVERTVSLAVLLLFWFAGGFGWLDGVVRGLFVSDLLRGLAFIGMLGLGYAAVGLPFAVHRTFVTEARFGFNRTTWRTFVADRAKEAILLTLLGGLLLSGVLLLFQHAGGMAWLVCWLVVVAFTLIVQWLAPALILPLFNRFTPMPDGPLRDAIVRYAQSVGFPLENVYVIDGSRRSSRANAYFTGIGRKRRIALFDTLIGQHPIDEIVAVLAHEVGHYRLRHVARGLALSAAHTGIALFLLSRLLGQPGLYEALSVAGPSLYAGFVAFGLLFVPIETLLSLVVNMVSRAHEFAADRFALDTAPSPASLSRALKTLSVVNLSHPNPHRFHVVVDYTHPPLSQRLAAIDRRLATPDGG